MWTNVSHLYTAYDPRGRQWDTGRVSIHPRGVPAPFASNGVTSLYDQARTSFPTLADTNVFTGAHNIFRGPIEVRRCHVVSDPSAKADRRPLSPAIGAAVVAAVPAWLYELDGGPAAGVMADASGLPAAAILPSIRVATDAEAAPRSVDYNALMAYLWAATQELQGRVAALETSCGVATPASEP